MSTNALFLLNNSFDSATLAASSAAATAPVENLQDVQRTKIWRSAFGDTSHIDVTLPVAASTTHAAIVDTNLTATGTIHVEAWDDALGGSTKTVDITVTPSIFTDPSLPSLAWGSGLWGVGPWGAIDGYGAVNERNISLIPLLAPVTSQFWRFTFADTGTSYQQCGRIYISSAQQFKYNLSWGWTLSQQERSVPRESIGGQRYINQRPARRQAKCDFQFLTDAERTATLIYMQQFGESQPFVFSVYPENTTRGLTTTFYGRYNAPQIGPTAFNINDFQLTVSEEL